VSQENVELVRGLQPGHDVDLAELFRDDLSWAALSAMLAPVLTPDVECVTRGFLDYDNVLSVGLDGLRRIWLAWLAPWKSYRTEVEDTIDVGDKVVVLVRDFARREADAPEVALPSAAVWTLRDGKVARIEFCDSRDTALRAAGLEE